MLSTLLLIASTYLRAEEATEDALSDQEIALIEQTPTAQFAYIPDQIRQIMLRALESRNSHEPLNDFWIDLQEEARIVSYDQLMQKMPLLTEYFEQNILENDDKFQQAKRLFFEYKTSLDNGEALLNADADTRSRTKKIHKLCVKCKLIAGCLDVCGNITFGGELIGPDGPITVSEPSNYLFAYSTAVQAISVANTFQTIIFSTVGESRGWATVGPAGSFTGFCPSITGVYQFTYTASAERIENGSTADRIVELRATLNGTPIAGSHMNIDVGEGVTLENFNSIISNSFQATINPISVIGFQISSAQTNSQISGESSAGSTVNPSITLTISQLD